MPNHNLYENVCLEKILSVCPCVVVGVYIYTTVYIYLFIYIYIYIYMGAAVAQWLGCRPKNRKVAGSIPASVS